MDRVLRAFLGAAVIHPAAEGRGQRDILFLDAREHLGVERLLERLARREHGLGVSVLGREVVQHLAGIEIVHPQVRVFAHDAMQAECLGRTARKRGMGRRAGGRVCAGIHAEEKRKQAGMAIVRPEGGVFQAAVTVWLKPTSHHGNWGGLLSLIERLLSGKMLNAYGWSGVGQERSANGSATRCHSEPKLFEPGPLLPLSLPPQSGLVINAGLEQFPV